MDSSDKTQQPTHYLVEEEYVVAVPMVRPKSLFLEFLREAGAKGEIFTMKEIVTVLKEYIGSRLLYDKNNPRVVYCATDFLGAILGVDTFTIEDVPSLIENNITYIKDTCLKTKKQLVKKPFLVANKSQTISRKVSTSSTQDTESVSSSETACAENSTVSVCSDQSIGDVGKKKKRKRSKKKRNKSDDSCPETKKRKRHGTDPSRHASPQPGSSGHQGTSISIAYGDSGIGDCPYLQVEGDEYEDDDGQCDQVGSTFSGIPVDDMWYINEGSLTFEVESDTVFSESDISSVRSGEEFIVVCKDSDVEFFADYSDSDSNSDDKDLTEADKWTCVDCNLSNPPYMRFCDKCWKARPDWLPNRKRSLSNSDAGIDEGNMAGETKSKLRERVEALKGVFGGDTQDSGFGSLSSLPSSQESHEASSKPEKLHKDSISPGRDKTQGSLGAAGLLADSSLYEVRHSFSNFQSKGPSSVSSMDSTDSEQESQSFDGYNPRSSVLDEPCIICLQRPKTASIVHGSSGHQVCCFTCAKRLRRRGKVCPVCRRPIQKVIRNFFP